MLTNVWIILVGLTRSVRTLLEVSLAPATQDASVTLLRVVCARLHLSILAPTLDVVLMLNAGLMVNVVYVTVHPTILPEIRALNVSTN